MSRVLARRTAEQHDVCRCRSVALVGCAPCPVELEAAPRRRQAQKFTSGRQMGSLVSDGTAHLVPESLILPGIAALADAGIGGGALPVCLRLPGMTRSGHTSADCRGSRNGSRALGVPPEDS